MQCLGHEHDKRLNGKVLILCFARFMGRDRQDASLHVPVFVSHNMSTQQVSSGVGADRIRVNTQHLSVI